MRHDTPKLDSGQAGGYPHRMEIFDNPTLGDLIRAWKEQKAAVEDLEREAKTARFMLVDIEEEIHSKMQELGIESASEDGVSVSTKTKWRAKYEPELWGEIVKWAANSGLDYVVQRRLNDAKIMELVDNGIALPQGLTVESYNDLAFRRS
jgi:hypothetical protein